MAPTTAITPSHIGGCPESEGRGPSAIGEFLTGTFDHFFQFLLGALELLLMEERESLIVNLHLGLDTRIDHFHTTTLRRMGRN